MEMRGAVATHVGNVRENNQDRAHFAGYVAVVADGMGGHQGGEMAASIAISEFTEIYDPIGPGGLVELVEEANRAVFEKAADPDLRGMGTTLVAMALRPNEEKVSIVNVGDSRAYFLRGEEFGQLTLDHSLVEDLVRQNRLTPEEALTHPQRNILTRALGIASDVEVDRFLVPTKVGDRFLLCSDGLFNEVTETEITRILAESPTPDVAADALVAAALVGPGRDNITVAVVDIVAAGEGGNVSSEAAETLLVPAVAQPPSESPPTAPDNGAAPESNPGGAQGAAPSGGIPASSPGLQSASGRSATAVAEPQTAPAGAGHDVGASDETPSASDVDTDPSLDAITVEHQPILEAPGQDLGPATVATRRRIMPRLVGLVGLAALAGLAYVGIDWYAQRTFFLADEGGQVALFRGRPGGFLWAEPVIESTTDTPTEALSDVAKADIAEGLMFDSVDEAETYLASESMPDTDEAAELLGDVVSDDAPVGVAGEVDRADESSPNTTVLPGPSASTEADQGATPESNNDTGG